MRNVKPQIKKKSSVLDDARGIGVTRWHPYHAAESLQRGAAKVDFNREIRPISDETVTSATDRMMALEKRNSASMFRDAALKPAKSAK